ncbi:agmatinase [uncultured Ruegeria sp.]|uniref:agmatinase n=1 Tax=uncultured Ruegeria sp. TaxID=259304 RepID=UPI00260F72AF|nr:agmatinase [uncultured Ruegeria sp.]
MSMITEKPKQNMPSFLRFEVDLELADLRADIAILGVPHADPYSMDQINNDQAKAPTAVRQASVKACSDLERWDFDLGGPVFDNRPIRAVDCGDVIGDPRDISGNSQRVEDAVRLIRQAKALPIIIGGDHGVPIPVLRGLSDEGPIYVIQIDAHLDWVDQRNGVSEGFSSPMRRASEMAHVSGMHQIGLRNQGSATTVEFEAAQAYGSNLVTAEYLHDHGVDKVLSEIPDAANFYITIDADGLDPSIMPAVAGPAPGGVTYQQACKLIRGLVKKGNVVGMNGHCGDHAKS